MATRIYLPSSGSAPVTPSTWNIPNQINPLTFAAVIAKINSALTTRLQATGTTSPIFRAMFRWVIGPLAAQSISGTINLVMRCLESSTGANATLAVAVKIIQPGGADRAVLLAYTASDSAASPREMTTSLNNKRAWNASETRPIPLTTQSAIVGDYLVIEVGFRSATTTTRNISIRYGDPTGSDLADADSGTNDYAPWIDFSADISFLQTRELVANIAGVSTMPDVTGTVLREILAAITGVSSTPDVTATMAALRELAANIAAGSVLPDISITTVRDIQTLIAAVSSTPDVTPPDMSLDFEFKDTQDTEFKDTQDVEWLKETEGETRNLVATIIVSSSTPDAAATIARVLQAAISVNSFIGAPNLLTNGGMEEGNPPTGWDAYNAPETFERSSAQKYSGDYSLHIGASAALKGGLQTFQTYAGKEYRVRFYYYIVSGHIRFWFINGDNSDIAFSSPILTTSGSWEYCEVIGTQTVSGSQGGACFITIDGAAEFYIDDGSVRGDFISATVSRALLASIVAGSITPEISQIMARALLANINPSSLTPDISITIARILIASITAGSYTPDITATMQGIISLIANIATVSITPDIAATTVRALIASISAQSATANAIASITRNLITNIVAGSLTPDITAQYLISLAAAIAGVSITPEITVLIARTLLATVSGQTVTSDAQAIIARDLLAVIHGTSITPDDLILILGMYTIRERIMGSIQTRFEAITPSGLDSIRQQIIDAIDTRLKTIS